MDDYTYHHSMIIHDNLLEFDQPTFERAIEILESMKSLYLKGSCANCGSNKKKKEEGQLLRAISMQGLYHRILLKCRKYIHVHHDNHPVYKINEDISNIPDKEVFRGRTPIWQNIKA